VGALLAVAELALEWLLEHHFYQRNHLGPGAADLGRIYIF
jgi:hypothetical protein